MYMYVVRHHGMCVCVVRMMAECGANINSLKALFLQTSFQHKPAIRLRTAGDQLLVQEMINITFLYEQKKPRTSAHPKNPYH